jgi:hypothetical protein
MPLLTASVCSSFEFGALAATELKQILLPVLIIRHCCTRHMIGNTRRFLNRWLGIEF